MSTEKMAAVLDAVEGIDFFFRESDCEQSSEYSPAPPVQEFEPANTERRRKLDEPEGTTRWVPTN